MRIQSIGIFANPNNEGALAAVSSVYGVARSRGIKCFIDRTFANMEEFSGYETIQEQVPGLASGQVHPLAGLGERLAPVGVGPLTRHDGPRRQRSRACRGGRFHPSSAPTRRQRHHEQQRDQPRGVRRTVGAATA